MFRMQARGEGDGWGVDSEIAAGARPTAGASRPMHLSTTSSVSIPARRVHPDASALPARDRSHFRVTPSPPDFPRRRPARAAATMPPRHRSRGGGRGRGWRLSDVFARRAG
ncbi:MAG: hypothetical protein AVDCRST_MAG27-1984 [uncultured Craurococcus sp.]|uniref:Uncharacterized protein n=1 Tax=uncultured Craurococcus sp. TaxID=1135998 RepID=A0A6J4IGG7_9PROT|nr:MAG: hypothetical protein AVDCRST_MAG27-1984 [uncultured Craurococcus sp.]